ncbi:MAG: nitroreductase family protein [Deltaproteobacteria bacterium]|nr:nitroreductase family protein [Deltaproteobacteria bacterium]
MRKPDHAVDPLFLRRWSPRAMSGAPLPLAELNRLFEAARWAPSSGNSQPWRFVVARREQPSFSGFSDVLDEGNQVWAKNAAALLVVCAQNYRVTKDGEHKPLATHAFDTGSAWMSLALQATTMGLVAHGMEGFDKERARVLVKAPDGVVVLCMVAIGLPGDPALLPEKPRAMEQPNSRDPIEKHVFDSTF